MSGSSLPILVFIGFHGFQACVTTDWEARFSVHDCNIARAMSTANADVCAKMRAGPKRSFGNGVGRCVPSIGLMEG